MLLRLVYHIKVDEAMQDQLILELYSSWLIAKFHLEVGDSIEPPEYIPIL